MDINIHKEVEIESTIRTELLSSMFEVPAKTKLSVSLTGELPNDLLSPNRHPNEEWNIGLIVGPSGSGKTLLLNEIFGFPEPLKWGRRSVIDDFSELHSMEDISRVCQSVGFNTIPSWLRPYSVLSNGERFRVETARCLLNNRNPVVIDEFTSVVDRQVAQFACHAIQKYVRDKGRKLVVASCHYDIINWLQPDWILEPGNPCRFTWRSLQGRPSISCKVQRVKYETWSLFRDFHYMSQDLNKAARCYGLYVQSGRDDSAELETEFHDAEFHSRSDGSGYNSGANTGLRIPTGFGMHGCKINPNMVLPTYDDGPQSQSLESEIHESEARSRGSFNQGPAGSGDSSSRAAVGRRHPEDESGDKLFTEETGRFEETMAIRADTKQNSLRDVCSETTGELSSLSRGQDSVGGYRRHISNPSTSYRIASMCGVLYRPHPRVSDIYGFTRMVTLPDFQGLGLAFVLACKVASAYKALGKRLHSYPNHPAWIRSYQRSPLWLEVKQAGSFSPKRGGTSTVGGFGGRRCAVFFYIGDAMNKEEAERLINVD